MGGETFSLRFEGFKYIPLSSFHLTKEEVKDRYVSPAVQPDYVMYGNTAYDRDLYILRIKSLLKFNLVRQINKNNNSVCYLFNIDRETVYCSAAMPQTVIWIQRTCFNHVTIQSKTNFSVERNWLTLLCKTAYEKSRDENTNVQVLPKRLHVCKTNTEISLTTCN